MKKALFLLTFSVIAFFLNAQITPGAFYKIQNNATGFYAGIDGKTNQGDPVLQQSTVGDGGLWEFVAQSGGYFAIKNKVSGKYIDNFSSTAPAAPLKQATNITDGAMWSLVDAGDGYFKLKNKKNNMFMGINGATDTHTPVVQLLTVAEGGKWKFLSDGSAGSNPVAQNNFTMLFVADPQYPWVKSTEENLPDQQVEDISKKYILEQASNMNNYANSAGGAVKGVIVNGDLTAFGRKSQMDVVMAYYATLTMPYFLGLGNHDYSNCVDDTQNNASASYMINFMADHVNAKAKTGFDYVKTGNKHTGSLSYSWDINNIHFVQLHNFPAYEYNWTGTPPGGAQQEYDIKASFNWLENDLNNARKAGKGIILNMHDLAGFNSYNFPAAYARLVAIINKYEVAAVFVGHLHEKLGESTPGAKVGNAPIYYSGAPCYNQYLAVDFKGDKMDVKMIKTPGNTVIGKYENIPVNTAAKTLAITTHPVTNSTAYSPNSDNKAIEFTNNAAISVRAYIRYKDAAGEVQNWYGLMNAGGTSKAWLPTGASDIKVYFFAKLAGSSKIFYDLALKSERSVCFKVKGTYDNPFVEICGTVPSFLHVLNFKNIGGYTAQYEIEYMDIHDDKRYITTDDVMAGQERNLYHSLDNIKKIKVKAVAGSGSTASVSSDQIALDACYKSSGTIGIMKIEKENCQNASMENYIRFKNTGAYIAVFTVTANGTTYQSGDVLAGQEKTVYFDGPASNLTAKVKSGPQIAAINGPGMNTCYKSWGILTSPKFAEGCN